MTYESNGLTSLTLEQYRMAASYTTRVMMIHKVKLSRLSSEVDFVVCIFQILGLGPSPGARAGPKSNAGNGSPHV